MSALARALVTVAAVLLLAGGALAEDAPAGPPPEAKKAFLDGKAAYERGDYEQALQLFQRASLIAPAPSLYYNIGMAYERLGRYEDSAIAFEKYLELIDAPSNDEERAFHANLRARAAANRARAKRPTAEPAPAPLVEPPQPGAVAGESRYPRYVYQPPSALPVTPVALPLTHQQKIDKARKHRNNGIALLAVGTTFFGIGLGLTTWIAVVQPFTRNDFFGAAFGLSLWGASFPLLTGITLLIPGAVALGKWQKELNAELKRPDDGAAARKAALDLAAPPPRLSLGGPDALVLATPPIRF